MSFFKMQKILNRVSLFRPIRPIISNYCSQTTNTKEIEDILAKRFPSANIYVEDKSGGCGAMFEIYVESKDFKDLTIPKQHKLVYETLKEQIKIIHGLRVVTKAVK